jgi:predicted nucleic acid-binding protein
VNSLDDDAFYFFHQYRDTTGENNKSEMEELHRQLTPFRIYWPKAEDCDKVLADLFEHYLSDGLKPFDALIGACALTHDAVLCTFNTKHFRLISGLRTEQPYHK